ncbi:MAG: hypothetical protein IJJ26_03685 [Victivallales bacterium]|nr:hypothetical protein [Victivallales bacterium]
MSAKPEPHEIVEAVRVDPRWARRTLLIGWTLYFVTNLFLCAAALAWRQGADRLALFLGTGTTVYFALRGFLYYKQLVGCCLFITKESLLLVRHLHYTCNVSLKATPLPLHLQEEDEEWLMNDLDGAEVRLPKEAYPSLPTQLENILTQLRSGNELPSTTADI